MLCCAATLGHAPHLAARVHTRVGPACGLHPQQLSRLFGKLAQRSFQASLRGAIAGPNHRAHCQR